MNEETKSPPSEPDPTTETTVPETQPKAASESDKERHDQLSRDIRKAGLTLITYSFFCFLTLAQIDEIFKTGNVKIPFANVPIKFSSFLTVGPLVLIVVTVYLHLFIWEWQRIQSVPPEKKLPFTFNQQTPLAHILSHFIFYALSPIVLLFFSYRAVIWSETLNYIWGAAAFIGMFILSLMYLKTPSFLKSINLNKFWKNFYLVFWYLLIPATIFWVLSVLLGGMDDFKIGQKLYAGFKFILSFFYKSSGWFAYLGEFFVFLFLIIVLIQFLVNHWKILKLPYALIIFGVLAYPGNLNQLFPLDLARANLPKSNLEKLNLRDVNLFAANLQESNLQEANLDGANLQETNFEGANLEGANLKGKYLSPEQLNGKRIKINKNTNFPGYLELIGDPEGDWKIKHR